MVRTVDLGHATGEQLELGGGEDGDEVLGHQVMQPRQERVDLLADGVRPNKKKGRGRAQESKGQ